MEPQDLINALSEQRNAAQNQAAQAVAMLAAAQRELETLKEQAEPTPDEVE